MKDGGINKLIDKYLAGSASASEAKQVDDWYAAFEEKESLTSGLESDEKEQMLAASFQSVLSVLKPKG